MSIAFFAKNSTWPRYSISIDEYLLTRYLLKIASSVANPSGVARGHQLPAGTKLEVNFSIPVASTASRFQSLQVLLLIQFASYELNLNICRRDRNVFVQFGGLACSMLNLCLIMNLVVRPWPSIARMGPGLATPLANQIAVLYTSNLY